MGNVRTILNIMRKFTPKGQDEALQILRENKAVLSREFGFAELPSIIAGKGKTFEIESQLLRKQESIRSIVTDELDKVTTQYATMASDTLKNKKTHISFLQIFKTLGVDKTAIINIRGRENIIKEELKKIVEQRIKNPKLIKQIKQANTAEEIAQAIKKTIELSEKGCINSIRKKIGNMIKTKFYTNLESLQIYEQAKRFDADTQLAIQKLLLSPNKSQKIKQIEQYLKKQYNLDFVYLFDENFAYKIAEALKIAKEKNLPIPKNIIVSPILPAGDANGLHFFQSNGNNTVMFSTKLFKPDRLEIIEDASLECLSEYDRLMLKANFLSENINFRTTDNPLHTFIHEIIHGESMPFKKQKIPKRFNKTISQLPQYAKEASIEEKRTELRTEEVLQGISKEKKELLDYLS